jgi:hypothetical protein
MGENIFVIYDYAPAPFVIYEDISGISGTNISNPVSGGQVNYNCKIGWLLFKICSNKTKAINVSLKEKPSSS